MFVYLFRWLSSVLLIFLLSACGGGTTGDPTSAEPSSVTTPSASATDPTSAPPGDTPCAQLPRSPCSDSKIDPALIVNVSPSEPLPQNFCKGDGSVQCGGEKILQTENAIAITASGVQTYGASLSNLTTKGNADRPTGLRLASGGSAEVRLTRDKNGLPSGVTLLLSNLGLSWDGLTERPPIIETFSVTPKRVEMSSNGIVRFKELPTPEDINFYDYAQLGSAATQSHYANNVYFPRPQGAACSANRDVCLLSESPPFKGELGDWKSGGSTPDKLSAHHLHLDGAVEVGAGAPPRIVNVQENSLVLNSDDLLGGLTPGAQGARHYQQWSYGWASLGVWDTLDMMNMQVWGGTHDHLEQRLGTIAFGTVTIPERIPQSGKATYRGEVHGWFNDASLTNPVLFYANADMIVNFVDNSSELRLLDIRLSEDHAAEIKLSLLTAKLKLSTQSLRNYLYGRIAEPDMSGNVGARFFGPIASGPNGSGPLEMAGSFNLNDGPDGSGLVLLGGFLLRKQ